MMPQRITHQALLLRRGLSSALATLGLLLLPKCPLCVAAYLVSLGAGAEAAHDAAPWVRPFAWLLVLGALCAFGFALWRARRASRRPPARCCCDSTFAVLTDVEQARE